MKNILKLLVIASTSLTCFGAESVNIVVANPPNSFAQATYTVPTGKVLMIDAMSARGQGPFNTTMTVLRINVSYTNSTLTSDENIPVRNGPTNAAWFFLEDKLRLKAGDSISPPNNAEYRIMGVLLDEEDLFVANLDVELDNAKVEGEKLVAEATVLSPRPHRLVVASSEDLVTFKEDPTALVQSTAETGKSIVSVDTEDLDKKFVRVRAQALPLK